MPLQELVFFFSSPPRSGCFKALKIHRGRRIGSGGRHQSIPAAEQICKSSTFITTQSCFHMERGAKRGPQAGGGPLTSLQTGSVKSSTVCCSRNRKPGAQASRFCWQQEMGLFLKSFCLQSQTSRRFVPQSLRLVMRRAKTPCLHLRCCAQQILLQIVPRPPVPPIKAGRTARTLKHTPT